jgi:hypothetical protein
MNSMKLNKYEYTLQELDSKLDSKDYQITI